MYTQAEMTTTDHYPWSDWMLFVLYVFSIFLALTSNSLVLAIFFKKKKTKTSATYRLMANMAISDILCSSFILLQWYFCSRVFFSDDFSGLSNGWPINENQSTVSFLDGLNRASFDTLSSEKSDITNQSTSFSNLNASKSYNLPMNSPANLHLNLAINLPSASLPTDEATKLKQLIEKTLERTLEESIESLPPWSNKFANKSVIRGANQSDKTERFDKVSSFEISASNSLEVDRLNYEDQTNRSNLVGEHLEEENLEDRLKLSGRTNNSKSGFPSGFPSDSLPDQPAESPAHLNIPTLKSRPNNRLQAGRSDNHSKLNGADSRALTAQAVLRRKLSSTDDSSAAIELKNKLISERMIKTNKHDYSTDESTNPINSGGSSGQPLNKLPLGRTEQNREQIHEQNGDEIADRNGHQTVKRTSGEQQTHSGQLNQQSDHRINQQPLHSQSKVSPHIDPSHMDPSHIDPTFNRNTDPHTEPHETNQYSLQSSNQIKELHQRSPVLVNLATSDEQFRTREKRDLFEQSTSQQQHHNSQHVPSLSTGELLESTDLNMQKQPDSYGSTDDSLLAAVDEPYRSRAGSTEGSTDDVQGTHQKKPKHIKDRLRNFVLKNSDRLLQSQFISQMPNCGQRICAILETLQMMGISVSTLTMAGIAYNRFNLINRPLAPKMDTTLFLTTIWLTSFSVAALASLSSLRVFVFFTSRRFIDCRIILSTQDSSSWELRKWRAIVIMAVQYVLPLSCISFLYVRVIKELRKCSLVRAMNQSSTSSNTSTLQHVRSVEHLLSRRYSSQANCLPGVGMQNGNSIQAGIQNPIQSGIMQSGLGQNGIVQNSNPIGIQNHIQKGTINRGFSDQEMFRIGLDEKPEINNNNLPENLDSLVDTDLKLRSLENLDNLDNLNLAESSSSAPAKFNLSDCLRRFSLNLPLFRAKHQKQTRHSDDIGRHSYESDRRQRDYGRPAKFASDSFKADKFRQGAKLDRPNDKPSDKLTTNAKLDGDQLARLVNKRLMNGRLMNKRSSSNESHSTFASSQSTHSQSVSAKLNLLNSELDRTKRRLTTMMIIVVLVFATAWLPVHLFHIKQFLVDSYDDFNFCDSSSSYLFFYFIAFSTNTYNPIIYFYFSKELRRDAVQMLKNLFGKIFKIKRLLKGCNC